MSNQIKPGQRVVTLLLPEQGLTLDPSTPEDLRLVGDLQRSASWLFAYDGQHIRLLNCSQAGALQVADVGSGLDLMDVDSGTGADTYTAGNTFTKTAAVSQVGLILETFGATIALFDSTGAAMDEVNLPVGVWSFPVTCYGGKIKNRTALSNCAYQFVWYS